MQNWNKFIEYDGSPRRFGMASNDDVDYYSTSHSSYKYPGAMNSPPPPAPNGLINYPMTSSPSPPRPGFPQRILSHSYDQSHSAAQLPKSYSFDDQQSLITAAYAANQQNVTTTSTLIPTTFINNSMSAYELLSPQEKTQATIVEEENEIVVDSQDENDDDNEELQRNMVTVMPEESATECVDDEEKPQMQNEITIANVSGTFDMTSPTEHLPTSTFDYLYEFSETRKVLEEFFKCPDDKIKEFEKFSDFNESDDSLVSQIIIIVYKKIFTHRHDSSCLRD